MQSPASFERAAPCAELKGIVNCFWEVQVHHSSKGQAALVVPDGSHELVVEMGSFEQRRDAQGHLVGNESAVMAGQLTHAFELGTPSGYHAFGIRLHPWGAAALLGDDVPAITNQAAPMQAALGARGRVLADMLMHSRDFDARVYLAQAWLREHARTARLVPWLPRAAALLRGGQSRVAGVAAAMNLSARQFERVFLRQVGLAPKVFARQQRFAQAAHVLLGGAGPTASLADVAQRCGYADQAHMARDFRAFAGLAPGALARRLDAVSAALAGLDARDVAFVQAPSAAWG
jgi:AraC-like DNA-binding protein